MTISVLEKMNLLKAEIAALEKDAKAARERRAEELKTELKCEFKYEVVAVVDTVINRGINRIAPMDPEYSKKSIRLKRTFLNHDEIQKRISDEGCYAINFPEKEVGSVTYFLYHDVLLHDSSGWVLLETPSIITKEEWEMLLNKVIPERLLGTNPSHYKLWIHASN